MLTNFESLMYRRKDVETTKSETIKIEKISQSNGNDNSYNTIWSISKFKVNILLRNLLKCLLYLFCFLTI